MRVLVTLAEASKKTSLPEHTIRRQIKDGRVKGVKVGRDWLLPSAEVERLAKEYPLQEAAGVE